MTPKFAFSTWHDAVVRLNDAARESGIELHPLPYRRFDPDADATWWLAPTSDNPAYADGKIVIEGPSPQAPSGPLVGFHVEKGVGPAAAELFSTNARGRRLMMNNGWTWRSFVSEMGTGRVGRDLAVAVEAAGDLPVLVTVVTAVQDLPSLEQGEERTRGNPEYVWYRPASGHLERAGEHNGGDVARRLHQTETMTSLANNILAIPDIDWRWVEIMIGIPFERVGQGGLTPSDVWHHACSPWRAWLR